MSATPAAATLLRVLIAVLALGVAGAGCWGEPVAPALVALGLALYGAVLWRWPAAWLVVVPALVASFDLAFWTGRLAIEEPDMVVLVTIAVLAVRAPPQRGDFVPRGVGGAAIALAALVACIGVARGWLMPGPPGGSSMIELEPANALRVAKGFFAALALMPFLRRAWRGHDNAAILFAWGMAAGLGIVAAAAIHERFAFTGVWNFDAPYRIVATFSDMHLGGGYVGAYVVMALPFVFRLLVPRRGIELAGLVGVAFGGLYTLIVTFARGAYGSAFVSTVVLLIGWIATGRRHPGAAAAFAVPAALLCVVGGVILYSASTSGVMENRLALAADDLDDRMDLWTEGLGLRAPGAGTALFGMGLGTYARAALAHEPADAGPGNFVLGADAGRRYLALEGRLPLYVGQRVTAGLNQQYRVSFALRATGGWGPVVAILCEKVLLYSSHCHSVAAWPSQDGAWQNFEGTLSSAGIGSGSRFAALRRPVEFAVFAPEPGSTDDVADIRLLDPSGRELLANGDFARGMARWFYTDDVHTVWRIENQPLMTLFEEGVLGLAALALLMGAALAGALRGIRAGDAMAPAFAAALVAFLASSLFDCPLEVPRLASLIYLIAFAAITLGERAASR